MVEAVGEQRQWYSALWFSSEHHLLLWIHVSIQSLNCMTLAWPWGDIHSPHTLRCSQSVSKKTDEQNGNPPLPTALTPGTNDPVNEKAITALRELSPPPVPGHRCQVSLSVHILFLWPAREDELIWSVPCAIIGFCYLLVWVERSHAPTAQTSSLIKSTGIVL